MSVAGGWAKEGLEAFSAARKLIVDAVARAGIDHHRAYALNILGRHDEAVRALRSARRSLSGSGEPGRAVLAAVAVTEAGLRLRQSRWADARALANEAILLMGGDTLDQTAKRVLADAMRYHDIAASELGGDSAMVHLAAGARAVRRDGRRAVQGEGAEPPRRPRLLSAATGPPPPSSTSSPASPSRRPATSSAAAISSANAAEILIDQGRVDEARPLIDSALRVFEASDNPYLVAFVTGFAGRIAQQAGDPEAARTAFRAAARRIRRSR